jgi:hypothetical protein
LLFFCLADVVFFFGVPAEPAAFATEDTPAAFFYPPPFFFIGADEGGGENGSLEVFAMRDSGQGQQQQGWRMIISWMMEVHVYNSMVSTLRHVSIMRYTSTHLIHKQIDQGDVSD